MSCYSLHCTIVDYILQIHGYIERIHLVFLPVIIIGWLHWISSEHQILEFTWNLNTNITILMNRKNYHKDYSQNITSFWWISMILHNPKVCTMCGRECGEGSDSMSFQKLWAFLLKKMQVINKTIDFHHNQMW